MYFNVVVKDGLDLDYGTNQLVFHFNDDFEEALKFAEMILKISDFHVEVLQFNEEDEEGKD